MFLPFLRLIPSVLVSTLPFMNATATDSRTVYDVVVIGATPSGVAAAVNAAAEGLDVALYAEDNHIGGLTAGGLSNSDFKYFQTLGGTWRDFMDRVVDHYATTYGSDSPQLEGARDGGFYEPGVARLIFTEMLDEAGVARFPMHRIESVRTEVNAEGRHQVTGASFLDRDPDKILEVAGTVFIDARARRSIGRPWLTGRPMSRRGISISSPPTPRSKGSPSAMPCSNGGIRLTNTLTPATGRPRSTCARVGG